MYQLAVAHERLMAVMKQTEELTAEKEKLEGKMRRLMEKARSTKSNGSATRRSRKWSAAPLSPAAKWKSKVSYAAINTDSESAPDKKAPGPIRRRALRISAHSPHHAGAVRVISMAPGLNRQAHQTQELANPRSVNAKFVFQLSLGMGHAPLD